MTDITTDTMDKRTPRHTTKTETQIALLADYGSARMPVGDPTKGLCALVPQDVVLVDENVDQSDSRLSWWLGPNFRVEPLTASGLYEFLSLGAESDLRILQFAQNWGPLGLCKHGLPVPHETSRHGHCHLTISDEETRPLSFDEMFEYGPWYEESLEPWRHYATSMNAIWQISYNLRHGRPIDWGTWKAALRIGAPRGQRSPHALAYVYAEYESEPPPTDVAPLILQRILGDLVSISGLEFQMQVRLDRSPRSLSFAPALTYREYPIAATIFEEPFMTAPTPPLISALAARLLASLGLKDRERRCDQCQLIFEPARPRDDRANYCSEVCSNLGDSRRTAERRSNRRSPTA